MMRDLIFDEESRRDVQNASQFGAEGDAGAADVVSANTGRVEIIYDKYELLKQVREVIALEEQDIGPKVLIQATLGSMDTSAWSVKVEAEQKSWAEEPETYMPPDGGFFSLHTNQIRIRNWAVIMRPSDVETTWSWLLGPHAGWPAPPHTVGTAPGRDPELLA